MQQKSVLRLENVDLTFKSSCDFSILRIVIFWEDCDNPFLGHTLSCMHQALFLKRVKLSLLEIEMFWEDFTIAGDNTSFKTENILMDCF